MAEDAHFTALLRMYAVAPVNTIYRPVMKLSEGRAEIEIELGPQFHHSAHGVHGSVYFKMLDDAAFFAANTLEREFLVLTTSFTTYLTRPVSEGSMRAVGQVAHQNRSQFLAEAVVYDALDREIGRGNGLFVRSKIPLTETLGYPDPGHPDL